MYTVKKRNVWNYNECLLQYWIIKLNLPDDAMLGANKQCFVASRQSRREEKKNIVSKLPFLIGNEKYSHKYMCFDNKSFGS